MSQEHERPELLWTKSREAQVSSAKYPELSDLVPLLTEKLAAIGIRVHPQSRVAQYGIALEDLIASQAGEERQVNQVLAVQAFQELFQLNAIASRVPVDDRDAQFLEKARLLLSDRAVPDEPIERPTPGRDTQFELFMLASLRSAGIASHLAEPPNPDIVIETTAGNFGIEAKRLRSHRKLKQRARHGNKQIKRVADGGILATDLTRCILDEIGGSAVQCKDPLADLEQRLYDYMSRRHERVRKWVSPKKTFAWLGYAQLLYHAPNSPLQASFQWKCFNLCHERDPRWLLISTLFTKLSNIAH
ncbi:MAG: hypothetical protein GY719_36675 [bacterium]|nr:hypothetical protein [bacterium]